MHITCTCRASTLTVSLPFLRQEALALQELCAQTCTAPYRSGLHHWEGMLSPWMKVPLTLSNFISIYRAPELFEVPSEATITASSDVWSLGCCLYAAAFSQSPFDGSALAAMSGRVNFPKKQLSVFLCV